LLLYEFYTTGQQEKNETELDLTVLLRELVSAFNSRAAEKNINLQYQPADNMHIIVQGNKRELDIIFRNLLDNALKYTPQAGQVRLNLAPETAQKKCRIEVADTGPGMSSHELQELFTPFYRSAKHRASISGTGLGLAIVKRLVANQQGDITVSSQAGRGTTFRVLLPYTRLLAVTASANPKKRVVIIGGVTAGPKAAARLRRLDEELEITIVEKSEFLSYSGCGLPAYLSGQVRSPRALMSTADHTLRDVDFFAAIKNIRVLTNSLALEIDREQKQVKVQQLGERRIFMLPYDILILATGGKTVTPPIPGLEQPGIYSLYKIEDAEQIKKQLATGNAKDLCIIGGGLIGIETAESLLLAGARVTILEKQRQILSELLDAEMAAKIELLLNRKGIKFLSSVGITGVEQSGQQLLIMTDQGRFATDLIILSTGVKPNAFLARQSGLELGPAGGVKVNKYLQTSDRNIYAIGDCAESINLLTQKYEYWPLGSVSTKMGRIAADNICGRKTEFNGFLGTAMFQLFDINVACTGLTAHSAHEHDIPVAQVIVSGLDKVHYTRDAHYIYLKIIAHRDERIILGAQGYGRGDVIAKIQILAGAITNKMTLDALFKLDLGHAPAFNQPIDIVQTACLVLNNKLDGLVQTLSPPEWESQKSLYQLLDVSPAAEHEYTNLPGSINIPLENIRLEDIPFAKQAKICLYSRTSSRAYEAYRYLAARGFEQLVVLEGGFAFMAFALNSESGCARFWPV
jgi:NADPH-dependent 2,4-dienoyl-CoA reductase/sulfur reductase-like enzyme/rhodanese-related sulfurtransferase/two-component sensor histidine kinase